MTEFDNLYEYFVNGGTDLFQPYDGLNFINITGSGDKDETPLWQLPGNFIFEENPHYAFDIYDDVSSGGLESPFFISGGDGKIEDKLNSIDSLLEEINSDEPKNYDYIVIPINNSLKDKLATIKI